MQKLVTSGHFSDQALSVGGTIIIMAEEVDSEAIDSDGGGVSPRAVCALLFHGFVMLMV